MDAKKALIWGGVAVAVVIGAVLLFRPAADVGAQDVPPARAQQLVSEGVRVIDVRTPGEFDLSHLPGAENVPVSEVPQAVASWDRSEPVLVYCTTGYRSGPVVRFLADEGFEVVYHLAAGIIAWEGDLESGTEIAPMPADVQASSLPIMYEFFTDW